MKKIVVATIIINEENKILLLQRTKDKSWGGRWNFPGGKYEPEDQNLVNTAKRETKEEAGIDISDVIFMGRLSFDTFNLYLYYTKNIKGQVIINSESDDYKWVKVDNLKDYEFPMTGSLNENIFNEIKKVINEE